MNREYLQTQQKHCFVCLRMNQIITLVFGFYLGLKFLLLSAGSYLIWINGHMISEVRVLKYVWIITCPNAHILLAFLKMARILLHSNICRPSSTVPSYKMLFAKWLRSPVSFTGRPSFESLIEIEFTVAYFHDYFRARLALTSATGWNRLCQQERSVVSLRDLLFRLWKITT
jgi:hypothetical protein